MAGLHSLSREDIVITGMACRFADIPDLRAFWRQILLRRHAFSPAPFARNLHPTYAKSLFDVAVPAYAATLGELFSCNPDDCPLSAEFQKGENPDLLFATQLAIDALRDSGSTVKSLPTDRVSLHLGYSPPFTAPSVNWLQHTLFMENTLELVQKFFPEATPEQMDEIRGQLLRSLPETRPSALISSINSVIASGISRQLGFAGPSFTLDGGVLSGIQALQIAMDDLLSRRSDIALAGAVQPPINAAFIQGIAGVYPFSMAKQLRPFSGDSTGTLPGEGGTFFVLKRLKDALKQHDRIYAIIRSTGMAVSGVESRGDVPSLATLTRAMSRAFHAADISPDSVQLVEAHGSGVPHSDQVELQALHNFYAPHRSGKPLVGVGSVKGNIGHTLWAAAGAGVMKGALALYHRLLPPQVEAEKCDTGMFGADSPIYLLTEARPWLRGERKKPRRACVSSIDFTGAGAVAVLEEYPEDVE